MTDVWISRPITPSEAAILHHPDRRTAWAPAIVVETAERLEPTAVARALDALAAEHSIVAARLRGEEWVVGGAPPVVGALEPGGLAGLCRAFDLASEPPLRVGLSASGRTLSMAAHHAALDGRALLTVASHLLGHGGDDASEVAGAAASDGPSAPTAEVSASQSLAESRSGGGRAVAAAVGARHALRRLDRPADRVAASSSAALAEVFVTAELPLGVPARVAALAAAACGAVQAWNEARGEPWRRVGLTIPVGGPPVLGNVSTHRRVDAASSDDIAAAVTAALGAAHTAGAGAMHPALMRLLAPVVERLSDSLLVSNLGLVRLPGAAAVDFYAQARGRSAVALSAASVEGGARRLTLRARDLTEADAQALLDATVERLQRVGATGR